MTGRAERHGKKLAAREDVLVLVEHEQAFPHRRLEDLPTRGAPGGGGAAVEGREHGARAIDDEDHLDLAFDEGNHARHAHGRVDARVGAAVDPRVDARVHAFVGRTCILLQLQAGLGAAPDEQRHEN